MEGETPPFWLNPDQNFRPRRRRSSSSLELWLVFVALLVILMVVFFLLPTFFSVLGRSFRRNVVSKTWDTLNLFLVLFAILCGILSRNTQASGDPPAANESRYSPKWYEYSGTPHDFPGRPPGVDPVNENENPIGSVHNNEEKNRDLPEKASDSGFRLRSSSSYPDLKLDSWVSGSDRRIFDDIDVYRRGSSTKSRRESEEIAGDSGFKTIRVDNFVLRKHKPKQSFEAVGSKEREVIPVLKRKSKTPPPPPSPPPPPPPPPPFPVQSTDHKSRKSSKLTTGGAKDIANAFTSLYMHRSSDKKNKKKTENESFSYASSPPPPPPPPPPSVFQHLFSYKKLGKSKIKDFSSSKVHSIPITIPPPPPMPPLPVLSRNDQVQSNHKKPRKKKLPKISKNDDPVSESTTADEIVSTRELRPKRKDRDVGVVTHSKSIGCSISRPPLPPSIRNPDREIEVSASIKDQSDSRGRSSSSIPLPPPPPPPPFRIQEMKFAVHGDFVRIQSQNSSNSDFEDPITSNETIDGDGHIDGDESVSISCPSPDVNTKADAFIANFHAGLRLQKLNSMKEKLEKAEPK